MRYTEKLQYQDGIADASFELAEVENELGLTNKAYEHYERANQIYKALGITQKAKKTEKALRSLEN